MISTPNFFVNVVTVEKGSLLKSKDTLHLMRLQRIQLQDPTSVPPRYTQKKRK
jgi:hypothetical protein